MSQCPHCQETENQVKIGFTAAGSQRYKCKPCNRKYTPEPRLLGYDESVRRQAVTMYMDGINQRRTARQLGVSQGSVSNWHRQYVAGLPDEAEQPAPSAAVAEIDELFTFVEAKKTESTS